MVVMTPYSRRRTPGSIPQSRQFNSEFIALKIVCGKDRGGRSQGYVWGVSAVSCGTKEIEDVGMV